MLSINPHECVRVVPARSCCLLLGGVQTLGEDFTQLRQVSFVGLFVQACAVQLPEIAWSISGCLAGEFLSTLKISIFVGVLSDQCPRIPAEGAVALSVTLSGGALFAS